MTCEILILHDSPFIKKTIQQILLTEFSEARGLLCDSLEEAAQRLNEQKFHLILCPQQAGTWTALGLRQQLQQSELNLNTPIIILTNGTDPLDIDTLASQGFEYTLPIPIVTKDLASIVNRLYNPREYRTSSRYFIPQSVVTIHCPEEEIQADIINISRNGIYCEMVFAEEPPNILSPCAISIQFSEDYKGVKLSAIPSKLLRLQVRNWNLDKSPQHMNGVWQFETMPKADMDTLDIVFKKAGMDMAELEKLLKEERERTPMSL